MTVSGSNRYLACGVSTQNPNVTVSSITFNGDALSFVQSKDNDTDQTRQSRAEYWELIAPDLATANVVVTMSSATAVSAGCVSFTNVDQATPRATITTALGDSAAPSTNISSASGQLVFDVTSVRVGTTPLVVGANQTQHVNKLSASGVGNVTLGMSAEAGGSTTTMSWTVFDGTSKVWTSVVVSLQGVAALSGHVYTVCNTNCDFTNSQLQTALDTVVDGDSVLLESGHTYTAPSTGYVLGKKCASPVWDCITLRTGVSATGTILSASLFPATGNRVTTTDAVAFAKMLPSANNEAALRTVYPGETGASCAAQPCLGSGWTVQWIEFGPKVDWAQRALIRFGTAKLMSDISNGQGQDTLAEIPQYLTLIQCYVHGGAFIGQHQGLLLSSKDARVFHNLFDDIKSRAETQAITFLNGIGPYDIENNQISATGENVMSNGSDTYLRLQATVTGTPSTTSIDLTNPLWVHADATTETATLSTDMYSGIFISITHAGTDYGGIVCARTGSTCALSPTLSFTPSVGDVVRWTYQMGGLTFKYNYLLKKPEWFGPILDPPTLATAVAGTGGTLSASSHCYRVSVWAFVSGEDVESAGSNEQCVTTAASGKVTLTWTADPNAKKYRVYGNGTTGTESVYWDVTAPTVTYVDTGTAGTTKPANTPLTQGTGWLVKNNFELKGCDGSSPAGACLIEGNIMDYSWCCSQNNIISIKVNNQNANDVSNTVRNLTFRNNWIRHGNRALALTCTTTGNASPQAPSGPMTDVTFSNNLWTDMSSAWVFFPGTINNSAIFITSGSYANEVPSRGCVRVSFLHNTFLYDTNDMNGPIQFNLNTSADKLVDFVLRDNIMARDCTTAGCSSNAVTSMKTFNPNNAGQGTTAWTAATTGSSTATFNAWPDGRSGIYTNPTFPTGNTFFPTNTALQSTHLTNYTTCKNSVDILGCALLASSNMYLAGSDGFDIGADVTAIKAFADVALSGRQAATAAPVVSKPRIRLRIKGGT